MQVDHVRRNMDGRNLAKPIPVQADPAYEARYDEAGMMNLLAQANEIMVRLNLNGVRREGEHGLLLDGTKPGPRSQLVDEGLQRSRIGEAHGTAPASQAGA
ncbi:hypothetical protein ACFB49_06500 [Sphingomonas sp. DBB INV C78]